LAGDDAAAADLEVGEAAGAHLVVEEVSGEDLLTEQRNVVAAQRAEWPLLLAAALTGMSRSAGRGCSDLYLDATESGHPVPNGSPAFPSMPLVASAAFGLRRSCSLPELLQRPNLKAPIDCSEKPVASAASLME
jgi:hypothetical protein